MLNDQAVSEFLSLYAHLREPEVRSAVALLMAPPDQGFGFSEGKALRVLEAAATDTLRTKFDFLDTVRALAVSASTVLPRAWLAWRRLPVLVVLGDDPDAVRRLCRAALAIPRFDPIVHVAPLSLAGPTCQEARPDAVLVILGRDPRPALNVLRQLPNWTDAPSLAVGPWQLPLAFRALVEGAHEYLEVDGIETFLIHYLTDLLNYAGSASLAADSSSWDDDLSAHSTDSGSVNLRPDQPATVPPLPVSKSARRSWRSSKRDLVFWLLVKPAGRRLLLSAALSLCTGALTTVLLQDLLLQEPVVASTAATRHFTHIGGLLLFATLLSSFCVGLVSCLHSVLDRTR